MSLIEQLEARYEARQAWREAEDARIALFGQRGKDIADAPPATITQFWCRKCRKDRTALGEKRVISWDGTPFAYYASHRACHALRRYITDKQADPYWRESASLRRDRARLRKDLLQPGQEGFDLLYSHKTKYQP